MNKLYNGDKLKTIYFIAKRIYASYLLNADRLANCCCTPYKILPFPPASVQPFGFLAQVQMSRWDIRCKSNRRRDDIPFPREPAQCARGRRLRPRRRGGEGTLRREGKEGKDVRNLAQKSITSDEKRESEIH